MRAWVLLFTIASICGCQSSRIGPYTAPRVVGQVVAAESGEPLADVRVERGPFPRNRMELKGGELMLEPRPARTDANGFFEFSSERALTIFRPSGWNTVRLRFERAGFERLQTEHSTSLWGTNSPTGEPLVDIGSVELRRKRAR